MKKNLLALSLILTGFSLLAQVQRVALYEEFTGETCPPCAATNPGLDALLKSGTNPTKIIPIKWQVPIPTAPSAAWSLYKTNKVEIDWRYSGYGYGINSAPSSKIDGQNATVFFAASSHPADLTNNVINTAANVTTPFAITITRTWDNTYNIANVTVNISSQGNYTAVGALRLRLVLIEREIHFATQPGSNGEKDFNWAVRRSYPDIQNGTLLSPTWTNGQSQTINLTCTLPSYIVDKSQVDFVGFIQDDGNKKVMQTAKSGTLAVGNDARAGMNYIPTVCSGNFVPQLSIFNNGDNAITAFDVSPKFDGVASPVYNWSGNLAVGASTIISLTSYPVAQGPHTFSYGISNVSGTDFNLVNNNYTKKIYGLAAYDGTPVIQDFSPNFPPPNWVAYSPNSTSSWMKSSNTGGYGLSPESAKVDFSLIPSGPVMELLMQPLNLLGTVTPTMTFDVAYAQDGSTNDQLQVFASNDCGNTWTNVYDKSGSNLSTRSPISTPFVPTADDWRTESVELAGFNTSAVLVKFTATSDYGNNLYIDNVNLEQQNPTVGMASVVNNNVSLGIYPNPSNAETKLTITSNGPAAAKVSIVNVLGQTVYNQSVNLIAGTNNIQLNVAEFAAGIYNVVIDSKNGSAVKKLNVTK